MLRPGGKEHVERSNLGGFANFVMSAGSRIHPVNEAGEYVTEPVVPDEFELTTEPARDAVVFDLVDQSPAGIAARSLYSFVGVAPKMRLVVPATIAERFPDLVARVNGEVVKPTRRDAGGLEFVVRADGIAELAGAEASGATVSHRIEIGSYPVLVSTHFFGREGGAGQGATTVIGFDDLITTNTLRETPSGYCGFGWRYWVTTQDKFYKLPGHMNNTVSGDYIAYTSSGHPAEIFAAEPFDFVGTYVGISHREGEAGDVILEAYRAGKPVYEERLRLKTGGPVYFAAEWTDIDLLVIRHEHYWHVVIDDIALRRR
jgi:hypothetical protein